MKTLVVVESPSKAEKIQNYLGKNYIVLASKGHIADLAKGGKFGMGVDVDKGFKPRYVLMESKISTLNTLIEAARECDQIFVASDPDREGEAIAWHLAQRLEGLDKPIKRMVFNEIKKDKLLKAVKEVREINMNLFHAQEARRIVDRLVGFMASPFLLNSFGPNLSAGRVQSVVTRMVIDRERAIEQFVPEDFYTIQVACSKNNEQEFISKYSGRLTDAKIAEDMRLKFVNANEFVVSSVLSDEKKEPAPAPLVTSSLQQIMSKVHGFGAERTMKAAQSLYESGYCTYIRTDSIRVSDDALKEVRAWLEENKFEIPKKPNTFKNKDAAQDAHECIRPSDLTLLPNKNMAIIDSDEKIVYETIWNYFVASQMMPAVYSTLKVTSHVKGDKAAELKATGRTLKSKGFFEILGINDDSKIDIPNLEKNDVLHLSGKTPVKFEKKQTQPLPRFSEDKLIKELVTKNIGRPATFADLLSKITSRNYVEKKGNVYHATEVGKKITDVLKNHFTFMDYDYTSDMEQKLDDIESGKINHIDMLKEFYPPFKDELNNAYCSYGSELCEKCKSPMITRTTKSTGVKFLGCSAFPKCMNIKK